LVFIFSLRNLSKVLEFPKVRENLRLDNFLTAFDFFVKWFSSISVVRNLRGDRFLLEWLRDKRFLSNGFAAIVSSRMASRRSRGIVQLRMSSFRFLKCPFI
jgi:hypothetical protein